MGCQQNAVVHSITIWNIQIAELKTIAEEKNLDVRATMSPGSLYTVVCMAI